MTLRFPPRMSVLTPSWPDLIRPSTAHPLVTSGPGPADDDPTSHYQPSGNPGDARIKSGHDDAVISFGYRQFSAAGHPARSSPPPCWRSQAMGASLPGASVSTNAQNRSL